MDKFTACMKFIALWEWGNKPDGGYTNDPVDPGGETKYGISKRQYPHLDIKNLKLADAHEIYKRDYWNSCGADNLSYPLCLAVFDTAINLGQDDSDKWLKETRDFRAFLDLRVAKYHRLVARTPKMVKYLKGWLNRVADIKKFADANVIV